MAFEKKPALKTYYIATKGLDVYYGEVKGAEVQNKTRGVISFANGTYLTADPEKQEFLDSYPGCISKDEWRKAHMTKSEREDQDKQNNERLQSENNALLAEIQKLKGGK